MSQVSTLQLSLTDIARLAGVQRPVVSMWRLREIAGHPFPEPVGVVDGQDRFDAQQMAAYLRDTARGNNPDAREDLAAHARLAAVTRLEERVALDGLTALLCLAAMTDESLGDLDEAALLALATGLDPADTLLVREIRALGPELTALAVHADALADAAYSARAAFEGVLRQQLHRSLPGHAATALHPDATALVALIAQALAAEAGMEAPTFVDVTDGSGDLLLAVTQRYAAGSPPSLATLALDSRVARLTRRRLRVHDLHRLDIQADEDGEVAIEGGGGDVVHVLQLPPAGQPRMTDLEVLHLVDDLVLSMDDRQRAVVLGPTGALTDRPATSEADQARDAILRTDRVRFAARLPKGLLVRAPRQALGLWVLGPAHPDVPRADRWTAIADLSDETLTGAVIEGVVTDAVAALTPDDNSLTRGQQPGAGLDDERQVHGHQFRFARRVRTATILPGRTALVDQPITPPPRDDRTDLGGTVDALALSLAPAPISELRVEAASPGRQTSSPTNRTLGAAVVAGDCRVIPGNRLDPADPDTGSTGRAVIGTSELLGELPTGARTIDLLTFAANYPSGRLTEPGDIIFCTSPHPAARVDHAGGSVVLAPARILRVTTAGRATVIPEVIAADITTLATSTNPVKDWRHWPIRHVARDQREPLAAALAAIDHDRHQARERLARLDALAAALRDGVTAGSLLISAALPPPQDHPDRAQSANVSTSDMPRQEGR